MVAANRPAAPRAGRRTRVAGQPPLSPNDSLSACARAVIDFHTGTLLREQENAITGEAEPVHQLRVATRRLRASVRLFARVMTPDAVRLAGQELSWLGRMVGGVRDNDVLLQAVAARTWKLEAELGTAIEPLMQAIRERRAAALGELLAALDSDRYRALISLLRSGLGIRGPSGPRMRYLAAGLVEPLISPVLRAGRAIHRDSRPDQLHKLRIRGKRLRYAFESLRDVGGKRLEKVLAQITALQDLLGEHQDAVTQIQWLRAWAETAEMPRPTLLATGAMIDSLWRRQRKTARRFPALWKPLERALSRQATFRKLGRIEPQRLAIAPRTTT